MTLTTKQKQRLRALGHHLRPVVIVGAAGVTEALCKELDAALEHHELVKVKINAGDRGERRRLADACCACTGAELAQELGRTALLFRPGPAGRVRV